MIPNGNGNPFPKDGDEPSDGEPAGANSESPKQESTEQPESVEQPAPSVREGHSPAPVQDVPLTAHVRLQPAPRPRPSAQRGLFVGGLLIALFGVFFLLVGTRSSGVREMGDSVGDRSASAKIVQIDVVGVIARASVNILGQSSGDLVAHVEDQLRRAEKDDDVKAVLLRIDSPGGTVTASDELWNAVMNFRKRSKKPVVVHMGAICASGGYYLAAAADAIVCEPTTITGSIGVILSSYNASGLMKEHGVQDVSITSGPNKDLLSPTAPRRQEHERIVQAMVDSAHARFTQIVADGRKLPLQEAKRLADGRIYTADQALQNKLVDEVGYREAAFAKAKALAKVETAQLVHYQTKGRSLFDLLTGRSPMPDPAAITPGAVADRLVNELRTPRLLALWRPTLTND